MTRLKPRGTCEGCGSERSRAAKLCNRCASRRKLQARVKVPGRQYASGIRSQRSRGRLTWEDLDDFTKGYMASLYRSGLSVAILGERFGASGEAVRNWLRRMRVQIRPRNGWPP